MAVLNFPDPAGQSPANTFGPASTPHATSNGVTYVWTDGSWSIASGSSSGQLLDKDTADNYYVEKAGDNMTGNLTLGTDKIALDATDGTAMFGGDVNVVNGNGVTIKSSPSASLATEYKRNGIAAELSLGSGTEKTLYSITTRNTSAGVAGSTINFLSSNNTHSGGKLQILSPFADNSAVGRYDFTAYGFAIFDAPSSADPVIKLNSEDGSAQFAGDMTFGPLDLNSNDAEGVLIQASGGVVVQREDGSGNRDFLWQGREGGGGMEARTSTIDALGNATFEGAVLANTTIGRSVIIQTEPDNDANYVTTTDVDTDGTTFETRVYNGPTLDVGAVIQELQQRVADRDAVIADFTARLAALEADHATLMGNSNEGY